MDKKYWITQAELAKLIGIPRQTVNVAVREGKLKKNNDSKIDFLSQETQDFINKRSQPAAASSLNERKTEAEILKLELDHTLKKLKIGEAEGRLISKQPLGEILFQYLAALNNNILDSPERMIDMLIDKIKSDTNRGEIIMYMRSILSKEITNTKKQVIQRLKNAR